MICSTQETLFSFGRNGVHAHKNLREMLLGGLAGTLITMFHTENERDNIQNRKDQKQLSYIHKEKQTKLPVMYQKLKSLKIVCMLL